MAKSKLLQANKKIEKTIVESYKKVESGVLDGYQRIENKFVDLYLTQDDETIAQAKQRLDEQKEVNRAMHAFHKKQHMKRNSMKKKP